MFYLQNISIYMNLGGVREDVHIPPYIFCLLLKNMEKVQEHGCMTYSKIKFYIISIEKKFLGWIINFL